jgi:hypothetical protein
MAETDTATALTASVSTAVTYAISPVVETDAGAPVYGELYGYWVSDELVLPGTPVTGSVIRWSASVPAGTSLTVYTSINGGASWDLATNDALIPRLQSGDAVTRSVIAKAVLTRPTVGATSPSLTSLELQVSCDSSTDELVSIAYGMVDKVTVHAVGGTNSIYSSTGAVSSRAVTSRGGGPYGSGTTITVHAIDLSLAIKRNVWQQPYTVPGGTITYGDAVKAMVLDRLPSQTKFSIATTTEVVPEIVIFGTTQGGDPWKDIRGMAQAIGYECFFDPEGVFVFQAVPDPRYGIPVWVFDEDMNPLVAEAQREFGSDQTFNDIVVIGQSTSSANAVSAEAMDLDPSSVTYVLGPYGRVSQRLTFPLVTTQSAAQAAATATLYNSIGGSDTVTITCVPHPALVPGDIVKINCSDVRANGTYMINSMTTSLSPADPQQLVCFRQSTTNT